MKRKMLKAMLCAVVAVASASCSSYAKGTDDPSATYGDNLTREQAEKFKQEVISSWKASVKKECQATLSQGFVTNGEDKMKVWYEVYGEKPSSGRSLYISMHGGGNTASSVNDSQWDNQKRLYTPKEGVYVAPRAPWDDWDMWFKNPIDDLFHSLIREMVVCLDVDPDKVYLMGYSAGGDGVWRMGPRMADTWAAASMMAGHPGDVKMLSLRNTPFMIWCGEGDSAYDRNKECARMGKVLDSLQTADPEGYVHSTHIVPDKGHWMDRVDTSAVTWMACRTREANPKRIVWCQGDRMHRYFYWIGLGEDSFAKAKKFDTIRAEVSGNTIDVTECPGSVTSLEIFLSDDLVDLDKEVLVNVLGKEVFKGTLQRSRKTLEETLFLREDPSFTYPAKITVFTK